MAPAGFQRLLLATEHGEFDGGAEALAMELARAWQSPLAAVLPLASNPEFEAVAPAWAAKAEAQAAAHREDLLATASRAGLTLNVTVRRGPEPFAEIVDEAVARRSDLIVIRRRGPRGLLANLLVGEMVSKVVAHAPCSVLVALRGAVMWRRRVLLGLDPLAADAQAVERAADVAAAAGLPLQVVCVTLSDDARPLADAALAAALDLARARGARADGDVRSGRVHQVLLDAAAECGADLLVIGRHRAEPLPRAWIGGVAQKVQGLATCPVLVHVPMSTTRATPP